MGRALLHIMFRVAVSEHAGKSAVDAVIFYKLIERVPGQGSRYLWFGWAGGRNLHFYERAGCKVTRSFQLFKKSI
jgi:hypothetical protein